MTIRVACRSLSAGHASVLTFEKLDLDVGLLELNGCLPIVGRTGIGKSTLLHVLGGLAEPKAGTVEWQLPMNEGEERIEWSGGDPEAFKPAGKPRARRFGFLLQDAAMIPCFTIEENLIHAMRLRGLRTRRSDRKRRIRSAVQSMAIENEDVGRLLSMYPGRLSGGQRQRMALAAATVHDPAVLFADEPTASLDDDTGMQVMRAVGAWLHAPQTSGSRAFVFVTHNLEIIRRSLGAERQLRLATGAAADRRVTLQWEATA